jgi:hypothetical protein
MYLNRRKRDVPPDPQSTNIAESSPADLYDIRPENQDLPIHVERNISQVPSPSIADFYDETIMNEQNELDITIDGLTINEKRKLTEVEQE